PYQQRGHHGPRHQLEGAGEAVADHLGHRLVQHVRGAQIPIYQAAQKPAILDEPGIVEPQAFPHPLNGGRIGPAVALAHDGPDRVPRHQVGQDEDDGEDPQEGGDGQEQAADHVAGHGGSPSHPRWVSRERPPSPCPEAGWGGGSRPLARLPPLGQRSRATYFIGTRYAPAGERKKSFTYGLTSAITLL